MPIQPISRILKRPTIRLNPEALIERPETATWIAQCIANWSWVESSTGTLFVNLLKANYPAGAALYSDMTSALAKDKALRSVALSVLDGNEYDIFKALLKYRNGQKSTRDKFAHWYWGVCDEIEDGLILVDPRYLMQYRADIIDLYEKGILRGAEIDHARIYVARVRDLKTHAEDFSSLAKLIFKFANFVVEQNAATREQRLHSLSSDTRIQMELRTLNSKKNPSTP